MAKLTRAGAISTYCRQCIHDPAAFGTWREQVATCTACECPLWRFRPLQDSASCPEWIKRRDPAALPQGWVRLEQAEAVRTMRRTVAEKASARAVRAGRATPSTVARMQPSPAARAPESGKSREGAT